MVRMTHSDRIVFWIFVEMIEMYSTDQALCLWYGDRILMGSDKIYNRKSASSADIQLLSDNNNEMGPYIENASHLLLIEEY